MFETYNSFLYSISITYITYIYKTVISLFNQMDHCYVETDSEDELPSNWEEQISANGFIHYVNVEKNQIQL